MHYAIHQPEEARGVYETWKKVAPKFLKVRNSKYKKFETEYEARYWSKHGKRRKIIYSTYLKDYAVGTNGTWIK